MLPILYQNSDFILYSYPLLMGLGWGIAYQIFFALTENIYPKLKAQILFWGIFLSAWLGAKFFFYITYPRDLSQSFLQELSFWTGGGFVFYGGFIGGFLFIGLYRLVDRRLNLNVLWALLPALAFGHGIGRIGCFLAGCCYGEPTDAFWGISLHGVHRHPTQLLEAAGLIAMGFYLLKSHREKRVLLAQYLVGYGILRLVIEALRGDVVRGLWGPLTPSQWISILLIISGITVVSIKNINSLQSRSNS